MVELLKTLPETPFWILAGVAVIYVIRNLFEGGLKSHFANFEKRVASSFSIKEGLRGQEQQELVEFRVSVEKWEYFLQIGIGDLIMKSGSQEFEPSDFHSRDVKLFGNVRIAAVKASIYLRDPQLEVELLRTVSTIRGMYYPLLQTAIHDVLELQGQLLPFQTRMQLFEASGMKDTSVALNADEAQIAVGIRNKMSGALRTYVEGLVAQYQPIGEQLYELKDKINVHIYRPLTNHKIDETVDRNSWAHHLTAKMRNWFHY